MKTMLGKHANLIADIESAHRQAAGKWTGCDWPTAFGKSGLNLQTMKASQALLLARATSGYERADWQAAVTWLTGIEQDSREAEWQAKKAVEMARSGQMLQALAHAHSACTLEGKYHRHLTWQPLFAAITAALRVGENKGAVSSSAKTEVY